MSFHFFRLCSLWVQRFCNYLTLSFFALEVLWFRFRRGVVPGMLIVLGRFALGPGLGRTMASALRLGVLLAVNPDELSETDLLEAVLDEPSLRAAVVLL